jgi:hypothetical protein
MIIKVNHLVAVLILIISFSIPSTILASENVLATQKKLNEMGFNAGTADGIWGNTTKNALIEYLSTKGLKFDGSLDKNEFELLEIKNIRNEKLSFRFNIDKSLPEDWVSEFKNIIEILQEVLPVEENFNNYVKNSAMDIYAWNSKVKNPFSEKPNMGGASVSGDGKTKWMVLEINKDEFKYNSPHRYSVIVHEYFHVYQIGLSKDRMDPKWLTEGSAKVIEEMFVQQYYGRSSLEGDFKRPSLWSDEVFTDPNLYEKFETSSKETSDGFMDMNYAGSAFMLLTLVKELQKDNISEQKAFKLVFRDFWLEKARQGNWKKAFEKTFNMSVKTFYERLSEYSRKDVKKILPSRSLKIQDIFD